MFPLILKREKRREKERQKHQLVAFPLIHGLIVGQTNNLSMGQGIEHTTFWKMLQPTDPPGQFDKMQFLTPQIYQS